MKVAIAFLVFLQAAASLWPSSEANIIHLGDQDWDDVDLSTLACPVEKIEDTPQGLAQFKCIDFPRSRTDGAGDLVGTCVQLVDEVNGTRWLRGCVCSLALSGHQDVEVEVESFLQW